MTGCSLRSNRTPGSAVLRVEANVRMLEKRPILATALVLACSGVGGFGLFAALMYLGDMAFSSPGEPDLGFLLVWLLSGFIVATVAAARIASALLKKYRLPLAQVPWYVFAMGYAVVLFQAADFLPV